MHLIKTLLIFTLATLTLQANLFAADYNADDILGLWLSEKKDGVIKISKSGSEYKGHLIAFEKKKEDLGKVVLDKNNDDEKLRTRKLKGIEMLHGFKFDDDEWSGGQIYDPVSGNTYKSYMSLDGKDILKLRGYVGISLFGRTSEWTRIQEVPEFKE